VAPAVARIRPLGNCFEHKGIYPLDLTGRPGAQDSIEYMLEDKLNEWAGPAGGIGDWLDDLKDAAIEAKDRALEATSRALLVRAIWTQMKQNAAAASAGDRGGWLLAKALAALVKQRKGKLQIHLVGHSAGAIILGHLLQHLPNCVSCTLYAPACTVGFAAQRYIPAVRKGQIQKDRFAVHVLSDELERGDSVGPYGKSLLYLVSRALEDVHKTAILGLARSFDPAFNAGQAQWNDDSDALLAESTAGLAQWQSFWKSLPEGGPFVETRTTIPAGYARTAPSLPANHGCFDNHAEVINATMRRILQKEPEFPPQNLDY
jgi:pimeloyl-ACP methyl ester carboxylesterase